MGGSSETWTLEGDGFGDGGGNGEGDWNAEQAYWGPGYVAPTSASDGDKEMKGE